MKVPGGGRLCFRFQQVSSLPPILSYSTVLPGKRIFAQLAGLSSKPTHLWVQMRSLLWGAQNPFLETKTKKSRLPLSMGGPLVVSGYSSALHPHRLMLVASAAPSAHR